MTKVFVAGNRELAAIAEGKASRRLAGWCGAKRREHHAGGMLELGEIFLRKRIVGDVIGVVERHGAN